MGPDPFDISLSPEVFTLQFVAVAKSQLGSSKESNFNVGEVTTT